MQTPYDDELDRLRGDAERIEIETRMRLDPIRKRMAVLRAQQSRYRKMDDFNRAMVREALAAKVAPIPQQVRPALLEAPASLNPLSVTPPDDSWIVPADEEEEQALLDRYYAEHPDE
jgi:hypothetical protein